MHSGILSKSINTFHQRSSKASYPLPTLFVVATPIGNLEDIAMRAVRMLRDVQLIAAEDTRTTRVLLRKYGINTRIVSYNEQNMRRRTPQLLGALETGDVALVSEAGTPGVSDPGRELIGAAIAAGFPVVPVPGPSAVIAALSASGLEMRQFTFLGFMPRRPAERRRACVRCCRISYRYLATAASLSVVSSPRRSRRSFAGAFRRPLLISRNR